MTGGDARIGNIVHDGFEPAAVLDREMAALDPRELALGCSPAAIGEPVAAGVPAQPRRRIRGTRAGRSPMPPTCENG